MRTRWSKSLGRLVCPCCGASLDVHLISNYSNYRKAIPSTSPSYRGSGYSPSKGGIKGGKKKQTKKKRFVKPTPEEVTKYAESIDFVLDGGKFCDFYESKDWMIGKNRMKDWKAAVRTWKRMRKDENSGGGEEWTDADKQKFYGEDEE